MELNKLIFRRNPGQIDLLVFFQQPVHISNQLFGLLFINGYFHLITQGY